MPGYVIHLAVGKVYSQNNEIKNIKDFEKGIITPDILFDKAKSHYGQYSSKPGLDKYIQVSGTNLNSYQEGYFLHLVTDYLFYNKFLSQWNAIIYKDYDILNARIIRKYGIVIPKEIESVVQFKDGNLNVLNESDVYNFINTVGKINIRQIIMQKKDYERQLTTKFEIERRIKPDESTR